MESLQISLTQPSTTSIRSRGIPNTSRLLSATPRTNVPPFLLAMAANSFAKSSRLGHLTLLPARRTCLSSSVESSPSRMRLTRRTSSITDPTLRQA